MLKWLLLLLFSSYVYAGNLHEAVIRVDEKALVKAIRSTSNIDSLYHGKSALMMAVESGNINIVKLLLNASANVNFGKPTPLKIAFLADDAAIASLLMDHHAKVPSFNDIPRKTLIYNLLLKRKYHSVDLLLKKGFTFNQKLPFNAFSLALSFAPISLIETFIKHGADVNSRDIYLDRPLDIALRLKRHDVVKLLIKNRAKVNDGYFLEIAAAHKDIKSLKILINAGCKIDKKRKKLLTLAVRFGDVTLLKELKRAGAKLDYRNRKKETVLTEAVKYNNKEIIKWLLESDLDEEIHYKAIFYAIKYSDLDVLKGISEKEIGLTAKSHSGLSPLLYAYSLKKFDMAKYLLSHDIDLQAKDRFGENALFKSIRYFQDDVLSMLVDKVDDINMRNRSGQSALDLALLTANFEAFKILLKTDTTISEETVILSVKKGLERFFVKLKGRFKLESILDEKENNLLHMAALNDRIGILKRLILSGFNLQLTNQRGETALHLAAKKGYKRSSSLLLSFGADIKTLDLRDYNAKNLALKNNHVKLAKWLEDYQVKKEELLQLKLEKELQKDNNESNVSTI